MQHVTSRARVSEVRARMRAAQGTTPQTSQRLDEIAERFETFLARAFAIDCLSEVTLAHVEQFVHAKGSTGDPSIATKHIRRTALRFLFRIARTEFDHEGDPALELVLPPRSVLTTRPLIDDEVALGRSYSLHTFNVTRQPAAWALAEATAITTELASITVDDLDLANSRVWLHGSRKRADRWGGLSEWACAQLERRASALRETRHLIYQGNGSEISAQVSCCNPLKESLIRAGLYAEPDVRPASVAAWAGQRILAETNSIEEVTRRLGMGSLDAAAAFIGYDWLR